MPLALIPITHSTSPAQLKSTHTSPLPLPHTSPLPSPTPPHCPTPGVKSLHFYLPVDKGHAQISLCLKISCSEKGKCNNTQLLYAHTHTHACTQYACMQSFLQAALEEANRSLEETKRALAKAKARLQEVEDGIAMLQTRYQECVAKKEDLAEKCALCTARLERAEKVCVWCACVQVCMYVWICMCDCRFSPFCVPRSPSSYTDS